MNTVLLLNYIIQLMDGLLALAGPGTALFSQITADRATVDGWRSSGHDPTEAELDALRASIAPALAIIDLRASQP